MQNALTNKIGATLVLIDLGYYQEALEKLENDILKKIDGCTSNGEPSKKDWIIDCESQSQVYSSIVEVIALLRNM